MDAKAKRIVVIGAGNIGRSFIGQLFSRGGWEVVFAEVDAFLVAELNRRRGYTVTIKRSGYTDENIEVDGVRAIDGRDMAAVARELATAELAAVSVGKASLPKTLPALASGLLARAGRSTAIYGTAPLDLIIAENDREARTTILAGLRTLLPNNFPLTKGLGLVRTSIGKMVPIQRAEDLAVDRLRVFAEAYNTLIVDRRGFLGPLPEIDGLCPVDNIQAYEDRKLFIHNLGHAAAAYFGYRADPKEMFIYRALKRPEVRDGARQAMAEAAAALASEYPDDLKLDDLSDHIDDLLERFGNTALGDTIYRVGRDLGRKLSRSDRILGPALLCQRRGLPWPTIAAVFGAALHFAATDESGDPLPADNAFRAELGSLGLARVLRDRLGLERDDPVDAAVFSRLMEASEIPG